MMTVALYIYWFYDHDSTFALVLFGPISILD